MKSTTAVILCVFSVLALASPALAAVAPEMTAVPQDIGAHCRLWTFHEKDEDATGRLKPSPRHAPILELETGRSYWSGRSWEPSDSRFRVTETAFIADRVHAASRLNAEINVAGAVQISINGIALRCTPLAVALYDPKIGTFAIIASLTNSTGILVEDSQVLYENALTGPGASCDVLYRIDRASFHQDVIFRCKPNLQGFSTNSLIQIISEFYDAPEPDRIRQPIYTETDPVKRNQMVSPDRMDETLGWDEFVLGQGHAYTTPSEGKPEGTYALVSKEYKTSGTRRLLFESIPWSDLRESLESLPDCSPSGQGSIKRYPDAKSGYAALVAPIPLKQAKAGPRKPIELAAAWQSRPGVAIDWHATLGSGLRTETLFAADTNYLIAGQCTFNSPVVLEATVVKFKVNASMTFNNTLTCKTYPYRPCHLTAIDDDSIGEKFDFDPSYKGPSELENTKYANPAIRIQTSGMTLSNVRFRYANIAIEYTGPSLNLAVSHSQFVDCIKGIKLTGCGGGGCSGGCTGTVAANVNNVLMARVQYPFAAFNCTLPTRFSLAHCTIDDCTRLAEADNNDSGDATLKATNCIFAAAQAFQIPAGGGMAVSGNRNGFWDCALHTFGTAAIEAQSNPFQTAGAGNYYLAVDPQTGLDASGFRDQGVTVGLPTSLLSDVKKTNYLPATGNGPLVYFYRRGASTVCRTR